MINGSFLDLSCPDGYPENDDAETWTRKVVAMVFKLAICFFHDHNFIKLKQRMKNRNVERTDGSFFFFFLAFITNVPFETCRYGNAHLIFCGIFVRFRQMKP